MLQYMKFCSFAEILDVNVIQEMNSSHDFIKANAVWDRSAGKYRIIYTSVIHKQI